MAEKKRVLQFYNDYFEINNMKKNGARIGAKRLADFAEKYGELPWGQGDLKAIYGTPKRAMEASVKRKIDQPEIISFVRKSLASGMRHYQIAALIGSSLPPFGQIMKKIRGMKDE